MPYTCYSTTTVYDVRLHCFLDVYCAVENMATDTAIELQHIQQEYIQTGQIETMTEKKPPRIPIKKLL